jgi:hypothetical protein
MCCLTLALPGGGYTLELRAGAGLAVWWVVLVGLLFGLIPRDRVPPLDRSDAVSAASPSTEKTGTSPL